MRTLGADEAIVHCTTLIRSVRLQTIAIETRLYRFVGNNRKSQKKQMVAAINAKIATNSYHFAIAQIKCAVHTKTAFQASSPKTFRPGGQLPGLFLSGFRACFRAWQPSQRSGV